MVEGDNAQMSVESISQVTENGVSTKRITDLEGLKGIFSNWYERVDTSSPEPFLKLSTGA
jgi:hypothetical protein